MARPGPELPAGTPVRIVGARGTVLPVELAAPRAGATP
jgi:membrane protein implicated in regulation of membrane protease activity